MTEEEKDKHINKQSGKIKKLASKNKRLKKRIKELEEQLYIPEEKLLWQKDIIEKYNIPSRTLKRHIEKGMLTPFKTTSKRKLYREVDVMKYIQENAIKKSTMNNISLNKRYEKNSVAERLRKFKTGPFNSK